MGAQAQPFISYEIRIPRMATQSQPFISYEIRIPRMATQSQPFISYEIRIPRMATQSQPTDIDRRARRTRIVRRNRAPPPPFDLLVKNEPPKSIAVLIYTCCNTLQLGK